VSFAAITLGRGQRRVIPKVGTYFVIDSVRKLLDTLSYISMSRVGFEPDIFGFDMVTPYGRCDRLTYTSSSCCQGR
jgi:hypothetical protein